MHPYSLLKLKKNIRFKTVVCKLFISLFLNVSEINKVKWAFKIVSVNIQLRIQVSFAKVDLTIRTNISTIITVLILTIIKIWLYNKIIFCKN